MNYAWLLLDADGTLFDYDRSEAVALEKSFATLRQRFDASYVEIYRTINGGLWQDFERGLVTPDTIKVQRFDSLFKAVGIEGEPEAFSRFYLWHLSQAADLIDGAEEILGVLCGRVGLVLITNGLRDVQRSRLAVSGIGDYFDAIVISEEVGFAKPHPGIFDVAFQRMRHPDKKQVLMVGDGVTSDIAGGNSYGIDTCWFNPARKSLPSDTPVDHEISSLAELLDIVGLDQPHPRPDGAYG